MNPLPLLIHSLRNEPARALPCILAMAGAVALLAAPAQKQENLALALLWLVVAMLMFVAGSAATRLTQAGRVLAQRPAPGAVWSRSVSTSLAGTTAQVVALLAVLALPWALGGKGRWPLLASAAMLSAAACAGTLLSALRSGLLLRLSSRAAGLAALAVILAYAVSGHALLAAAASWPAPVLWASTLSWPMMAWALRRHWRAPPAALMQAAAPAKADQAQLPDWIVGLSRRVPLQPLQRGALWQTSVLSGLQMALAMLGAGMREGAALGNPVTVGHVLSLVCFVPAAILAVSMRDLHWRTLLLPGGVRPRSLAFRIYKTTLRFAAGMLASGMVGVMLCDYLLLGKDTAALLASLQHWVILAMEVPLLAAVAVLLTALPRPPVTLWCSLLAAVAAYLACQLTKLGTAPIPALQAGPAYAALMLGLAAVVMLIAGRVWTPRRLLPYLPERPTGAAFGNAR